MITITPADEAYRRDAGLGSGTDAMLLREGGAITGRALFRMNGDEIEILAVECDEPLMKDGLIRSVLNTGDCRGAVTGVCRIGELGAVLRGLEFREKDGVWRVSIEDFFRAGCSCHGETDH